MNLADKPCYPYGFITPANKGGLTFRERLIIALASNPAHIPEKRYDYAGYLLSTADAIIKELEAK